MSVHREAIVADPAELLQHVITMSHRGFTTLVFNLSLKIKQPLRPKMKQETSFWLWTVVFLLYFSFSDGSLTLAAQHLQTPTRWAAVCTSRADLWSSDKHREESSRCQTQLLSGCSAGDVALLIPMKAAQLHQNSSTRWVYAYRNTVESDERPNYRLPPANVLNRDYK